MVRLPLLTTISSSSISFSLTRPASQKVELCSKMKVEVKCQILYLILNSLDIAIPLEIHYRRLKGLVFFFIL